MVNAYTRGAVEVLYAGAVEVRSWCGRGAVEVRLWCGRGTLVVRSRYARGAVEVRSWYGPSAVEVRSWCASGSLPVRYVSLTFQRAILYMLGAKHGFAKSMDCAAQFMDPYFARAVLS